MIYLTGCSNAAVLAVAERDGIGLMAQPLSGYQAKVADWPLWAADNGCFAQGASFRLDHFLTWLTVTLPHRQRCLFAVAPDVFADAHATLVRSLPVLPRLRTLGFRAAFVAQNGLTVAETPWDAFDVLFIGGDDEFKLGGAVQPLINAAKRRGKWVHSGRINSFARLTAVAVQGCDSADGTYLGYGPDVNLPRLRSWLHRRRIQPVLPLWNQEPV